MSEPSKAKCARQRDVFASQGLGLMHDLKTHTAYVAIGKMNTTRLRLGW